MVETTLSTPKANSQGKIHEKIMCFNMAILLYSSGSPRFQPSERISSVRDGWMVSLDSFFVVFIVKIILNSKRYVYLLKKKVR